MLCVRLSGLSCGACLVLLTLGACGGGSATPARQATGAVQGPVDAGASVDAGGPLIVALPHTATAGYVEFEGEWVPGSSRLVVRVFVGGFSNLFGIAGHLRYDPAGLDLTDLQVTGVPAGKKSDAADWSARGVAKDAPAGRILAGSARVPIAPTPFTELEGAAVARELWLKAVFRLKAAGAWTFAFDPLSQVARGADGKDITTQWQSLTITVTSVPPEAAP